MKSCSTHTHTHTEFPAKSVTQSDPPGTEAQTATHGIQCVLMTTKEIVRNTEIAPTLMARDYKGIGKYAMAGVVENAGQDADGIYIGQSESFHRGPLKGLSRTLKAENDAGVVIHGDQL